MLLSSKLHVLLLCPTQASLAAEVSSLKERLSAELYVIQEGHEGVQEVAPSPEEMEVVVSAFFCFLFQCFAQQPFLF